MNFELWVILFWWLILFSFNFPIFYFSKKLFKNLPDFGYPVYKILGLALVSYLVWLASSLHLFKFTQLNILVIFFGAAALNIFLALKNKLYKLSRLNVLEEAIFLFGLLAYVFIRSFKPEILGLEKFTDFSFVNAVIRAEYMPPTDAWFAGFSVNYYYFGHFVTALLAKLSGINPAVVYNLMLGTIFGLALSAGFSVGYNLIKSVRAGLLTAVLITLGGTWHTIYAFTKGYPVAENAAVPFWDLLGGPNFAGYWYPMAVRFIPYSIHEFPAYSFTVGDLHAHLLDIPFVMAFIVVIIATYMNKKFTLMLPLITAVTLMTNSLDAPIYLGLGFLLIRSFRIFIPAGILVFLMTKPFYDNFVPFVSGIKLNTIAHTPLWMFLIVWGFFLFVGGYFLVKFLKTKRVPTDYIVFWLLLVALGLIIFPELAYFKDIYPLHFRANTMFKLGYQAFILFSIVTAYTVHRFKNKLFILLFLPQLYLIFIYPYFSFNSYYGFSTNKPDTLNGLAYMQTQMPEDLAVINWFNANVTGQKVIVEAVGESYTSYARISTNTGLPAILGWPGHEWGWHMSPTEVGIRREEVRKIYEGTDLSETKMILNKYNVEYIILGDLEREAYIYLQEEKFEKNFPVVFKMGKSTIYKSSF
ncbi:hypothetical protein A2872_04020 [Candidatus Gottesmanbacteria bacterium RIFCSPHIGHO2_01_FULL_42_12]|uniref:YYY membrane protein n=1 Tax=Candidatus Gottesmanbacteria bacterium RIFCSPHIGHO2_01_FULL_42_12 TaxID=1798377 RepID=A0A1F5Z4R3_9BACT|nr:MAG: hypothetical protein A2872_04020 [Candidatus Gottesmanbacteria bacterium RIFCSPHIGHO2_01_FULL_42_12]